MRIALFDIAARLGNQLKPLLAPGDEIVEVPAALAEQVEVDALIASRFTEKEAARVRFRLLQVPGAGTDKIDFAAVDPAAFVCNAYEHEGPIAEYVFAAILDHAVGYSAMTRRIPEAGWAGAYFNRPAHREVAGATLGLIGLGHIGAAVAQRAKAFGMKVMAVSASGRTDSKAVDWIAKVDRLDEMLPAVDYLVIACPLNEETRGLLAMPRLKRMKPSALIVNVARAEIADESDLFHALKDGVIGGAVLDPWYRYPTSTADTTATPSSFPFETLPNVRMTPHSSAWTDAVWERRSVFLAENIRRLGAGEPLRNVVRPPLL